MSEFRVAYRYAKSLLDLSIERGVLEDVHQDMQLFSQLCDENRAFVLLLKNPIISHAKKNAVLEKVFKSGMNEMTLKFFNIITKKGREMYLPQVAITFHKLYNEHKGIEHAIVTTSVALTDSLRKQVVEMVKSISKKEVELEEKVNADLIGGFLLRVGDKQLDESISSKLRDLRQELTKNPYIKTF